VLYHYYLCWLVDSCDVCSGGAGPSGGWCNYYHEATGLLKPQDRVGVTIHQL